MKPLLSGGGITNGRPGPKLKRIPVLNRFHEEVITYHSYTGTGFAAWTQALEQGLAAVRAFKADAVVIALGVDTYEGDPISKFQLKSADYLRVGRLLAGLDLPAVFTMEGGYAVADVGINVANVLEGYAG